MGLVNRVKTQQNMPSESEPPKEVTGFKEQAEAEAATPEEDDLNPEEREVYDSAMNMAGEILYKGDQSSNAMMEQIAAGDPTQTIPDTLVFILDQIEQQFNGEVPEDLILPITDELSDMMIEMADTAGVIKGSEQLAIEIKGNCVEEVLEAYGVNEADMQQAMQGMTEEDLKGAMDMFGGQNGRPA